MCLQFGNNMRVDPSVFVAGREVIEFELCITKGTLTGKDRCAGGQEETNVGVTTTYAFGPDAQQVNSTTKEVYYGLYKIDFFPFNSGRFTPQVKHNQTYVNCYFDSSDFTDAPDKQRPCKFALALAALAVRGVQHRLIRCCATRSGC